MDQKATLLLARLIFCAIPLSLAGCGGEGEATSPTTSISSGQKTAAKLTPQAAVVQEFLQAAQQGDRDAARQLLTAKAIARIEEQNLTFLPAAVEPASFRIGQTVEQGNTHFVQCVWTSQDAAGQKQSENIQWMVKEESRGNWAIFGMAVHLDPAAPPVVFNFEQAEELVRQRQESGTGQPAQTGPSQQSTPLQAAAPKEDPFQSPPR